MTYKLLPFVAILASFGLFFGYINPTYSDSIKNTQGEISQYDSALQAAALYTARETELTQERDAIPQDELTRLSEFLPDGVDNVQLILDLTALSQRSGITLSGFTIGDSSSNAQSGDSTLQDGTASLVDSITLSVSATGTYASFRTFLSGVETSLRPLDVTAVTLKNSDTGVYTYNITFRIYWLH